MRHLLLFTLPFFSGSCLLISGALNPLCGDGFLDPGELCDDGNALSGDGCNERCLPDDCGNGVLDAGEECDDANSTNGDGCNACRFAFCGNGILDPGEVCDDGNNSNNDGCRADCSGEETCGNGVVDPDEDCDDANQIPGDGCENNCLFSPASCGDNVIDPNDFCFDPPQTLTLASGDFSTLVDLAFADINNDGDTDLLALSPDPKTDNVNRSQIFTFNNTLGTLVRSNQILEPEGSRSAAMSLFDIDGDHDIDIATADRASNLTSFFRNLGATFDSVIFEVIGNSPNDVATLTANEVAGNALLFAQGEGIEVVQFSPSTGYQSVATLPTPGHQNASIQLGDCNQDGTLDVFLGSDQNNIQILEQPLGGFVGQVVVPSRFDMPQPVRQLLVADFDNDGLVDIVAAIAGTNSLIFLHNLGNCVFATQATLSFDTPSALAIADLNHNNKPDLLVTSPASNEIAIYLEFANATNQTVPSRRLSVGASPRAIAIADVNGDALSDIAVANEGNAATAVPGSVTLYLSNP